MVKRNLSIASLTPKYLFNEIQSRKNAYISTHPTAKVISLGLGDTTEPIPESIAHYMSQAALDLSRTEGYTGYGPEQGGKELRDRLSKVIYNSKIDSEDIFISDGAKCDIGRLQLLFGYKCRIAVQDPAYPVYVDTRWILGVPPEEPIIYLTCLPDNEFFPNLNHAKDADIIYFCSPNNPTGATASFSQLESLVHFAKTNRKIIIFDAAYSCFIQDPSLPKTIYEIPGANEVAIELGSFSKMVGFTGVRLGWTVVPKELMYEDGSPVKKDWSRIVSTFYNGASNIAQKGGIATLTEKGLHGMQKLTSFYSENAKLLKRCFISLGYEAYGGDNAPYIWVRFPSMSSWEIFEMLLEKAEIITTPGSGFGKSGEGYIRLSAFAHRNAIYEAVERLNRSLK